MTESVKISAVLHTYNEEAHLEECLKSVRWCDEVFVVDLGSKDRSVEIAEKYADRVLHHAWVPIVEYVKKWSYAQAKYDWILCLDPDEVYPPELACQLRLKLNEHAENIAVIKAPLHYFFRGKALNCCMWYPSLRPALQNRHRALETGTVHTPSKLSGKVINIDWNQVSPIIHYWNDSWGAFIKSHWRYIKMEGEARYKLGKRFGFMLMVRAVWKMFRLNLIEKDGYKGGLDGILLSFAMGVYEAGAHLSLFKYQWDLKRGRI